MTKKVLMFSINHDNDFSSILLEALETMTKGLLELKGLEQESFDGATKIMDIFLNNNTDYLLSTLKTFCDAHYKLNQYRFNFKDSMIRLEDMERDSYDYIAPDMVVYNSMDEVTERWGTYNDHDTVLMYHGGMGLVINYL